MRMVKTPNLAHKVRLSPVVSEPQQLKQSQRISSGEATPLGYFFSSLVPSTFHKLYFYVSYYFSHVKQVPFLEFLS